MGSASSHTPYPGTAGTSGAVPRPLYRRTPPGHSRSAPGRTPPAARPKNGVGELPYPISRDRRHVRGGPAALVPTKPPW
eukprot:gene16383-biopygen3773